MSLKPLPDPSTSSTSCWQSRILCLQQHNCSVPMAPWPFSLSQRQLSWQALLFYSHYLCILLKSFLCSPWPPFYCHFCPKCPVYSLSISLQLSLEETLAAGDFPATFTCWGLLLIWHLNPQLTQQGLNRTSILQKTHSLFPMKSVKGIRKWQICCGKIWWSSIPLFCFQELNNVSLFITSSLSEKNKSTNGAKVSSENHDSAVGSLPETGPHRPKLAAVRSPGTI